MKLGYIPLERKLVLIYCMMKTLQSRISLIQSQIHQPVINYQHRLNKNVWIIDINVEEPITAQGAIDELNRHQSPREKYRVKVSLCIRKRYQGIDLEDIRSRFDQVRPVVSHLEVCLPKQLTTPKNMGGGLKGPQR